LPCHGFERHHNRYRGHPSRPAVLLFSNNVSYVYNISKARKFFYDFRQKWEKELPSAVKCLQNNIENCLTFFNYPKEEWISLRTTNIIERLNKEFKRRTKPMEIVAGENACYTLLSFICLKMEMHWKTSPIGKVRPNLPFFQKLAVNTKN
jgi:putative transposase